MKLSQNNTSFLTRVQTMGEDHYTELKTHEEKIKHLQEKLARREADRKKLKEMCKKLKESNERLREGLRKEKADRQSLVYEHIEQLEERIRTLKKQFVDDKKLLEEDLMKEIADLQNRLTTSDSDCKLAQQSNKKLKADVQSLKEELEGKNYYDCPQFSPPFR